MLDLTVVSSGYGETQLLHGLSLRAEPGRVLAILGRNGAGKSTTLKTIMGLLPAKAGQVSFDGQKISGMTPFDIAKRGIAYVPETRDIFRSLTVRENLDLAARRFPCPPGGWTVERVIARFPRLGDLQFYVVELRQHGSAAGIKPLSRLGHGNGIAAPVEQKGPQIILNLLDLTAQRRLRHAQTFRSAAKMQLFGKRDEVFQLIDVHGRASPPLILVSFVIANPKRKSRTPAKGRGKLRQEGQYAYSAAIAVAAASAFSVKSKRR